MSVTKPGLENVLYFFDRFTNPAFVPKGKNWDVVFDIPEDFYPRKYKKVFKEQQAKLKSASKTIPVKPLAKELNLDQALKLGKKEHFTLFNPLHKEVAGVLIEILLEASSDELISTCVKITLSEVNPYAFEYALSVALLHREDTKSFPLPTPAAIAPEFYVPLSVLRAAMYEASIVENPNNRHPIKMVRTATNADPEHRVAYFREDFGINIHHWHWHVVYPHSANGAADPQKVVCKDRRGELFYYMHTQIMARYNTERLCNKLNRTKSLIYFHKEIPEAYFSKLDHPYTKSQFGSRQKNAVLADVNRDSLNFTILDLELWRERILGSIHNQTFLRTTGKLEPIDPVKGIDDLGNIVESSILSKNQDYYGNLHNYGHVAISSCHDPEYMYLENVGPMGDNKTAMRDPLFYRWHSMMDDLFVEHKKTLKSYTNTELNFENFQIKQFGITSKANPTVEVPQDVPNKLFTYMQLDQLDLSIGLDIKHKGSLFVQFPHLQHVDFEYELKIENTGKEQNKKATVRIFMVPVTDESEEEPFKFNVQRRYAIELDKFVTPVLAPGKVTTVKHCSKNSSVTIPYKQMFSDIEQILDDLKNGDPGTAQSRAYCGCGWPHHFLIPKGTPNGFKVKLFAMITDYDKDQVDADTNMNEANPDCSSCKKDDKQTTAYSYCGMKDKMYPDKKPMGFPFDRLAPDNIVTLKDFIEGHSNMAVLDDVTITFKDFKEPIKGETIIAIKPEPFSVIPEDEAIEVYV